MVVSSSVCQIWQCHAVPLPFLLAPGHACGRGRMASVPCWGESSAPHCSHSCQCFYFLSSALSLTRKPHPLSRRGRKQAVIPKGHYSSKSWLKHLICCVFYGGLCVGAWQKAGKVVLKFSIEKQLNFKFFLPVSLVNKLKMSSHCDVLAESTDESQGGANGRVSGRGGRSYCPPIQHQHDRLQNAVPHASARL